MLFPVPNFFTGVQRPQSGHTRPSSLDRVALSFCLEGISCSPLDILDSWPCIGSSWTPGGTLSRDDKHPTLFGRSACSQRRRPPQCSFSTKYQGRTSPLPSHLLVLPSFIEESSALILRIDYHNGIMSEERTLELSEKFLFSRVDGLGRVIEFLVYSGTSVRLIVIHLDHPGVTLESEFTSSYVSNVHFFRVPAMSIMWIFRPIEGTLHSYRQLSGDLRYRKHFLLRTSGLSQSVSCCQPH